MISRLEAATWTWGPMVEIDDYSEFTELGYGAFGVVYRARQVAFDRVVAVKVIDRADLRGEALRRFERECLAVGALSWHPNIVVVYDAGTTIDGLPYLAMEYLPAGTLADRVQQDGSIDWQTVTAIAVQLAGALASAHHAGILHRDVKPQNVLVGRFGEAKLADFGVASLESLGTTRSAFASPAHAAPEVLAGQAATSASDVYSLASTLYELLAGAPAFVEDTDESVLPILHRAANLDPPDLRRQGVPAVLADVVVGAMAKEPDARPPAASLGAQLCALQRAAGLDVTPIQLPPRAAAPVPPPVPSPTPPGPAASTGPTLPPPGGPVPLPEPTPGSGARRRRLRVFAGVAVAAILVIATASVVLGAVSDDDARGPASAATPASTSPRPSRGTVVEIDRAVTSGSTLWLVKQGASEIQRFDPGAGGRLPRVLLDGEAVALATDGDDVWALADQELVRIDGGTGEVRSRHEHPQFTRLLVAEQGRLWEPGPDDTVQRLDAETGDVAAAVPVGGQVLDLETAFGSVWAVVKRDTTRPIDQSLLLRIDPATERIVSTTPIGPTYVGMFSGAGALWLRDGLGVLRVDPETGEAEKSPVPVVFGLVTAGGDALWTAIPQADVRRLYRWDPASGRPLGETDVGLTVTALLGSPDLVWAIDLGGSDVAALDPANGNVVWTTRPT